MYVFGVFNTNKNSESWANDYFDLSKVSKQLIKIQTERGSSLIYDTSARRERHKCDTIATRATRLQHGCDTSATRVLHQRHECDTNEILILITTRVKTYFHIPIFSMWQVKDYKERNNFILTTTFGTALFQCHNAFEKCTTKTELCNGKS